MTMILVTGATGNVGCEVVRLLVAGGEQVEAVTRHPATSALPAGALVVEGDPTRPQTLKSALSGVEAIMISPRALGDVTAGKATAELLALAAERGVKRVVVRSEEHTSELQSPDHLVCRLLLEKKKNIKMITNQHICTTMTHCAPASQPT